ncbi:MAG: hypothetical protein JW749_00720, partial [Sedimentisphaerales bacterium]|nr:hypothetical protein [Sedimentisphaerales bacterium]
FVVGTIMIAAGTAYNVFIIQRGSFGDFAMQFGVNWGSALIGKCVGEGLGLQTSIEGGDIIGAAISGAIVGSISGVFCSDVYGQNAWRGAYRGAAWGAGMAGGFAAFNAIANGGGGNVTNELVGPPETPTVNIEELSGIANSWLFEGCGCQEITLSWSPAGKFGPSRVIYFGAGGKLVEGGSITDISAYGSFEAHFVGGVGMGAVTCIDENGVLNIFYYHKLCIGGTIMGGGGGGLVRGLNGINCRPNNYSRWFYEIGGGVGVGSVGFDIGYDSSNWGLPGSFTGVFEGGGGIGPPGPTKIGFKSSWCYYFIDEVQKFPSN